MRGRVTLSSQHTRWLFVGCLTVLGISSGLAVTSYWMRRQVERQVPRGYPEILQQAARDLTEAVEQRRQVPLFLRDTQEKAPNLTDAERAALARSIADRAPYLIAAGALNRAGQPTWWVVAQAPASGELQQVLTSALRQSRWRNLVGFSSRLLVPSKSGRNLLVFLEPLRVPSDRFLRLVALFDFEGLAGDVLEQSVPSWAGVRLMEDRRVLYRTEAWPEGRKAGMPVLERHIRSDGVRWVLQMTRESHPPEPSPLWRIGTLTAAVLALLGVLGMVWAAGYLGRLAMTDELTGLYNRRLFLERWSEEVERAKRYQRNLSCIIIDVNGFKQINDLAGHLTGDQVLKQIAQELNRHLRQSDILARFGGDEFVVALPEADSAQAGRVAQKLRGISLVGSWNEGFPLGPVTLSVGLAQFRAGESPQQVIERADEDLYATRGATYEIRPILKTPVEL